MKGLTAIYVTMAFLDYLTTWYALTYTPLIEKNPFTDGLIISFGLETGLLVSLLWHISIIVLIDFLIIVSRLIFAKGRVQAMGIPIAFCFVVGYACSLRLVWVVLSNATQILEVSNYGL